MPDCLSTTIDVARQIHAELVELGIDRRQSHGVTFVFRDEQRAEVELRILPMTPDGEVICDCG